MTTTMEDKKVHEGRNLRRVREILGIKQDALASELGEDWNQQKISLLEQKEVLDPKILEQVAKVLKVPVDVIKKFDEDATFNIIANTYNDNSASVHYSFNPIDKMVELYERVVKEKDEKIALLEKLLNEKNK